MIYVTIYMTILLYLSCVLAQQATRRRLLAEEKILEGNIAKY